MFFRVWLRSLAVKRPQSLLAFAALALGATVASLLLNLYGDAQRKMTSEFRAYGANVIAAPAGSGTGRPAGSSPGADAEGANPGLDRMPALEGAVGAPGGLMDAATAAALQSAVRVSGTGAPGILAVPVLYVVATAAPARDPATAGAAASLVAVGTDFAALHALNPAWKFTGSETATNRQAASEPGACVLGKRAAERLGLAPGDRLRLSVAGIASARPAAGSSAHFSCAVTGLVASGKAEDEQAFVPLARLQKLAGLGGRVSLVEMRVPGPTRDVETAVKKFSSAFPSLEIRPVREIVQSEGEILRTLQALVMSLAGLIVGVVALCVMATVTTIVLERRKEVAVMKALGATDRTVLGLLLTEIGALGLAGGAVGFALGVLFARRLGVDLFGVALHPAWWTLGPVMLAALLVAALPALAPVSIVRSIDPARSLRGE